MLITVWRKQMGEENIQEKCLFVAVSFILLIAYEGNTPVVFFSIRILLGKLRTSPLWSC